MELFLIIAVCSLITFGIRLIPFVLLRGREIPGFISYLGRYLPPAIMAALVVFLVAPGLRATQGLLQVLGGEWLTFLFYLSAVVMLFGAYWLLRLSYRALTRREIVTQKWMNL